jgi:hypothetical protein
MMPTDGALFPVGVSQLGGGEPQRAESATKLLGVREGERPSCGPGQAESSAPWWFSNYSTPPSPPFPLPSLACLATSPSTL